MTLTATPNLRQVERKSIRAFVQEHSDVFKDSRVLDFGCGKQPYREVVEDAGGEYIGYDRRDLPANVSGADRGPHNPLTHVWDAVLSTQVIQYVSNPLEWLEEIRDGIKPGGHLVLTGPTNWPIVEVEDRWRFTPTGIASLLNNAGWFVVTVDDRAEVRHNDESWLLGWGALARA